MNKISLSEKFSLFSEQWAPRIIGEANGQYLKIAKVQGEFVDHSHANEDETFLCVSGRFGLRFPELGTEVILEPGELFIVPAGVVHCPFAEDEAQIMIFEPIATAHTGEVEADVTKAIDEQPWV
jgi:mannose-6-phosphate isomerase-like protein (cupin superfamily)